MTHNNAQYQVMNSWVPVNKPPLYYNCQEMRNLKIDSHSYNIKGIELESNKIKTEAQRNSNIQNCLNALNNNFTVSKRERYKIEELLLANQKLN